MTPSAPTTWRSSRWFAFACMAFILCVGAIFLLAQVLSPSFWYIQCAVAFLLGAVLWRSPKRGAAFSMPLLGVLVVEQMSAHLWTWAGGRAVLWVVAFSLALVCSLVATIVLTGARIDWRWVCASGALAICSFTLDRTFVHRVRVAHEIVHWSADKDLPWGEARRGAHGEIPVTLYEIGPAGYCYDSVFSEELKARLIASNKPTVAVTYNVFFDWGKHRGYNLGSVAGMTFNEGERQVRSQWSEGGLIEIDHAPTESDCHQ